MNKSIFALTISLLFSIAFVACGDSGADAGDSNNSNWKKDSSSELSFLKRRKFFCFVLKKV